uniref:Uncharacterized protein n=1 Tax=Utricularia reniformis TaxID=192314 RepID=A0A1Y0AZY7_9LAMI|nr:hypothetical protein AEK19_MT0468 [Utricularia reniformis]ART30727.1 hypothetical protein AEK19_MT0468 [Utricularia reniformis]
MRWLSSVDRIQFRKESLKYSLAIKRTLELGTAEPIA